MSTRSIHLTNHWTSFLLRLPEKGMGYHLVNVILKNGQVLRHHKVLNSSLLLLEDDEHISPEDIEKIQPEK